MAKQSLLEQTYSAAKSCLTHIRRVRAARVIHVGVADHDNVEMDVEELLATIPLLSKDTENLKGLYPTASEILLKARQVGKPALQLCHKSDLLAHGIVLKLAEDVTARYEGQTSRLRQIGGMEGARELLSDGASWISERDVLGVLAEPLLPNWPISELELLEQELRGEYVDAAEKITPAADNPRKAKRSTERGEGRAKLIAALTKHHKYAKDSCLNQEPIGNNKLARLAGVSESTASAFFKKELQGHTKYRAVCGDKMMLVTALKLLNQEFSPYHLYGGAPGEGQQSDE